MSAALEELQRTVARANESQRARNQAERIRAVIEFVIHDTDTKHVAHVAIGDGRVVLRPGPHIRPDVRVEGEDEHFLPVFAGDVSISHPISLRRIRVVRGRYLELVQLEKIIVAARKRGG